MCENTLDYALQITRAVLRLQDIDNGARLLCRVGDPDTLLANNSISDTLNPMDALLLYSGMPNPFPITYRRLSVMESKLTVAAYIQRCAEAICDES